MRSFGHSSFGLVDGTHILKAGFLRKLAGGESLDFGPDPVGDALRREEQRGAQPEQPADDESWDGLFSPDNGRDEDDDEQGG